MIGPTSFGTAPLGAVIAAAAGGAVLLAVASGATRLLRRAPAATRHAVWCAALAGQAALLPLGALLPEWRVSVPDGVLPPAMRSAISPRTPVTPAHADAASPRARMPLPTEIPAAPPPGGGSTADENAAPTATVRAAFATEAAIGGADARWSLLALAPLMWGGGVLLLVARLGVSALAVVRLGRRSGAVRDARWLTALDDARAELGIDRPVRLLCATGLGVPVTWGIRRPVVVLPDGADEWAAERRRVVLLHELAHVKRLDILTQTAGQLAAAFYWPNPLVWMAAKRMRAECERACDDCVLAAGTRPSRYVEDLVDIVRTIGSAPAPAVAALAMARRTEFEGRVLAILDPRVRRATTAPRSASAAATLATMLVLLLATMRPAAASPVAPPVTSPVAQVASPVAALEAAAHAAPAAPASAPLPSPAAFAAAVPAPLRVVTSAAQGLAPGCTPEAGGSHSNMETSVDGGLRQWRVSWSGAGCSVELRASGEITFNADVTDVETIAPGGFFELSYRVGDELTRLEIRPAEGRGAPERRFAVNGTGREYDGAAREWLAAFLAELDMQTAFAADIRFPRLFREGGAAAVLAYVLKQRTDYARNRYLMKLLDAGPLGRDDVRRVLRTLRDDYDGDFERARALMALSGKAGGGALADESIQAEFVEVAAELRSDFERTRVLMAVLAVEGTSAGIGARVLRAAADTKSDFELARLLTALAGKELITPATERDYLRAAATIESDFERARVLLALLGRRETSNESVTEALALTRGIKSDFEKARVLVAIAFGHELNEAARAKYREIAGGIGSEHEYGRAMKALPRAERAPGR